MTVPGITFEQCLAEAKKFLRDRDARHDLAAEIWISATDPSARWGLRQNKEITTIKQACAHARGRERRERTVTTGRAHGDIASLLEAADAGLVDLEEQPAPEPCAPNLHIDISWCARAGDVADLLIAREEREQAEREQRALDDLRAELFGPADAALEEARKRHWEDYPGNSERARQRAKKKEIARCAAACREVRRPFRKSVRIPGVDLAAHPRYRRQGDLFGGFGDEGGAQ